jgi:dTDP-4-amino-4,6-dideoxygalactose transaminase
VLKTLIWSCIKAHAPARARPLAPGSSEGGFGFDPDWLDKRASVCTRLLLRAVSRRRMGALRRAHYLRMRDALADLPGCRPLFAGLPDGVYPWVFPLWVDDPAPLFQALKTAAVPVLRFGEFLSPAVTADTCAHSVALSRHVLQFPCHQELRAAELDWLIAQIRSAVQSTEAP